MPTIRFNGRAGGDGVLHLDVPVGAPDAECEVIVLVPSQAANRDRAAPEAVGWPSGYFDKTAGAWQGDFVREQGQYEQREQL